MSVSGISPSVESIWGNAQSGAIGSLLSQLDKTSNSGAPMLEEGIEKLFSTIDTDGDGNISKSEMEAMLENQQGLLASLNDMPAQMAAHEANKTPDFAQMASKIVAKLDSSGDGAVSQAESSLSSEKFSALDANGDGKLDTDELTSSLKSDFQSHSAPPPPPPSKASSNSSSSSEIEGDTDGDGKLSEKELAVLLAKHKGQIGDLLQNVSKGGFDGSQLLNQLNSSNSWMYNFNSMFGKEDASA